MTGMSIRMLTWWQELKSDLDTGNHGFTLSVLILTTPAIQHGEASTFLSEKVGQCMAVYLTYTC